MEASAVPQHSEDTTVSNASSIDETNVQGTNQHIEEELHESITDFDPETVLKRSDVDLIKQFIQTASKASLEDHETRVQPTPKLTINPKDSTVPCKSLADPRDLPGPSKVSPAVSRETIETILFPFFNLPQELQCTILRNVPFHFKISTLNNIPMFSNLLDCSQSWLNQSAFNVFCVLRSLEPGFYLNWKDHCPNHGFYVSADQKGVLLTMRNINNNILHSAVMDMLRYQENEYPASIYKCYKSLSTLQEFLIKFLGKYTLMTKNEVSVYELNNRYFLVNHAKNIVLWGNNNVYEIKDDKCCIYSLHRDGYNNSFLDIKKNKVIHFTNEREYAASPFIASQNITEKQEIEPISCEAFILLKKTEQMNNNSNTCIQFEITDEKKEVLINMEYFSWAIPRCFGDIIQPILDGE